MQTAFCVLYFDLRDSLSGPRGSELRKFADCHRSRLGDSQTQMLFVISFTGLSYVRHPALVSSRPVYLLEKPF